MPDDPLERRLRDQYHRFDSLRPKKPEFSDEDGILKQIKEDLRRYATLRYMVIAETMYGIYFFTHGIKVVEGYDSAIQACIVGGVGALIGYVVDKVRGNL